MTKKKTKEPKAEEVKAPEPNELKKKIFTYAVFDQSGHRYIRSYKDKKKAEMLAHKPESKEGSAGYDLKKNPNQRRSVMALSEEEYEKIEDMKIKIDQDYAKRRKLSSKNYNVLKPKDFKGFD